MNIITNFIPSKIKTCDYPDSSWMNGFINSLVCAKNNFYKNFVRKRNSIYHLCAFKNLPIYSNPSMQVAKQNSVHKIAQKLDDPNTSSKYYWLLLITLLKGEKIPCIPPLFHGDKFIIDFQEKRGIFNSFRADQSSSISNGSALSSELPLQADNTCSS